MKLLEVGNEHMIVMLDSGDQVMYHHQVPIAAKINGSWYRAPNNMLISIGHVHRYLRTVEQATLNWVAQQAMDRLVEAL